MIVKHNCICEYGNPEKKQKTKGEKIKSGQGTKWIRGSVS